MRHAIVCQAYPIGIKSVCLYDVSACAEVFPMDVGHDLGTRQAQQIVIALHYPRNVGKARAPEIGLGQAVALYHGAHRPVQHKDAATHQLLKCIHDKV